MEQQFKTIRNEEYISLNLTEDEIERKREELVAELNKYYPNLKRLKQKEYSILKAKAAAGSASDITELMEKSLMHIFMPVVYCYSKYKFKHLDFEDALNVAYARAEQFVLANIDTLPEGVMDYIGLLSLRSYADVSRYHQTMLRHNAYLIKESQSAEMEKEEFFVQDSDAKLINEDMVKRIYSLVNTYPEIQQRVFYEYVMGNKSSVKLAEELGCTRERIRQIKREIARKLLRKLKYKYNFDLNDYEKGNMNAY